MISYIVAKKWGETFLFLITIFCIYIENIEADDGADEDNSESSSSGSESSSNGSNESDDDEENNNSNSDEDESSSSSDDEENSESESEDEEENDDGDEDEDENEINRSISGSAKSKISEIVESETNIIQIEENNNEERNSKFKTKSFTLPFFFRYIAWIVSLGTIVTSIFFLFGYGITFGNDKTYQWVSLNHKRRKNVHTKVNFIE